MPEMVKVPVPVEKDFWLGIESGDLGLAEKLLIEALTEVSRDFAEMGEDDSILTSHLRNYVTQGATLDEMSVSIERVDWNTDGLSGTIQVSFGESEYRGCRDLDYQGDQEPVIPFGITDSRISGGSRTVWIEVLGDPGYFSPE